MTEVDCPCPGLDNLSVWKSICDWEFEGALIIGCMRVWELVSCNLLTFHLRWGVDDGD